MWGFFEKKGSLSFLTSFSPQQNDSRIQDKVHLRGKMYHWPFHTYCTHTHTHTHSQPGVLCRVTPWMSSLSSSSSPATILQAECRLDTDQPHASRSNEQCEPNGRASGGGERLLSYFTLTGTTAVENVNVFHMIRLFGDIRRPSITLWNGCHGPWREELTITLCDLSFLKHGHITTFLNNGTSLTAGYCKDCRAEGSEAPHHLLCHSPHKMKTVVQ